MGIDYIDKLKKIVKQIKRELKILYFVYKDAETSIFLKIYVFFVLSFALSPIDLIPDFIPILGYLDDVIIIPFLIIIAYKFVKPKILSRAKENADENQKLKLSNSKVGAILTVLLWICIICLIVKNAQ